VNPASRFEPLALLFGAGLMIGSYFPLARIAGAAGVPPLTYAACSAAGACVVLASVCRVAGQRIPLDAVSLRYAAIAGLITFAVPFGVLALVIPHLGSGIPAVFQSLAPVVTCLIVFAIGWERLRLRRLAGIGVGFVGAILILFVRNPDPAVRFSLGWSLAALSTPLALALGNVFRSTHWPQGRNALALATLTLGAAAASLMAAALVLQATGASFSPWRRLESAWPLLLLQSATTGVGYAMFFRLQQVGGPIYLSQISYVNTAVGLGFAVALFSERFPPLIWFAMALIVVGLAMVNSAPAVPSARR
jgi:drug/metabolite transporter (DMT)-like permease